jgi:ADP-heptose:LPS heptosyltransferase
LNRIAVFRALLLGDMLCAIPALRALRAAAPHARITLIGLPWAREFQSRFVKYIDSFMEFTGCPGMPEQCDHPGRLEQFLLKTKHAEFDLVIQLHGSGPQSNQACFRIGARRTAGYFPPAGICPDPETFLPYPADGSEVSRNLRLVQFLGAKAVDEALEFPIGDDDYVRLSEILGPRAAQLKRAVCIHPGGKLLTRRWPAERFAAVANQLGERGYYIVLTGTEPEQELVSRVANKLRTPYANLCGKTDLGALAALIQRMRLVITNDTGVSHLAAALRTCSVVIFLGSNPERWAPLDHERHRTVMYDVPCRPCEYARCPIEFPCAQMVSVDMVLQAALDQLTRYPSKMRQLRSSTELHAVG